MEIRDKWHCSLLEDRRRMISEMTGFDSGERFTSPNQVAEYFTPENQREMFGDNAITDQAWLIDMAYIVIRYQLHCDFPAKKLPKEEEAK